ncbi:shikimate kinase [Evansella halocellulosilytica]|uniref:shikimate kinase n=1 Tax=Evansella halocellulosilytica TaxID=2011013 RepID=UPI000BB710D2|nr:shikimate kinase [Evansella halocellulosilytica]
MTDKEKNIYLIGFMGVGKTTIGKQLAEKLNKIFIDLDEYIESKEQRSIKEIFSNNGEVFFRQLESDGLQKLKNESAIIATGGGIVENEQNVNVMKQTGVVIFLNAPFHVLLDRIKHDQSRPLTKGGENGLYKRYYDRLPHYHLAHVHFDTSEQTPDQVCHQIIHHLMYREAEK